jgi:hypothetical protein
MAKLKTMASGPSTPKMSPNRDFLFSLRVSWMSFYYIGNR